MNKYLNFFLVSFGIILLVGVWMLVEINNDFKKKRVMSITREGNFVLTKGVKVPQSLKCFNSAYIDSYDGKRTSFCIKEGLEINCTDMSKVFVYIENHEKLIEDNYFCDDVYEGYWEATEFECLS